MKPRIIFMGTPQIAADVLEALLHTDSEIVLAVSQPDRPVGRKHTLTPSPVKELARKHNIPVFQPEKIRSEYAPIQEADADLIVTCAYGQIVPREVLDAAKYGCVNLHGSILPKYRGGAPIQRAIWNGDTVTGMTLMQMAEQLDAGPVFACKEIAIEPDDNSGTLFEKMGKAAGELIQEKLNDLLDEDARYIPQDESQATFAPIIRKEEEKLDLTADDEAIACQIRALAPAPGAWLVAGGKKLKILEADIHAGIVASPFTFFSPGKGKLALQLKDHWLDLKQVQPQGKPVMEIRDFANGQGRNLPGTLAGQGV